MTTTSTPKTGLQRSRLLRLIVAVLVLIPLVVSAIYMWVLWDPTKTVKDMPVAIVNQDVGYTDASGETNAGANVANNLVESAALGFQVVDRKAAYQGLNEDDFYFVIDIPKDFSQSLKTITQPEAAPALITVTFNDNNTIKASSIGASAIEKIYASVLKGVSSTTTGALVDGTQKLADGLRTAADGSQQLADGTSTLASGVTEDLAPGVDRAREGSTKLAAGANTLSDGMLTLQSGTDTLGSGATELADGIERLTGAIPLAEVNQLLNQAQSVLPNASALSTVQELISGLERLQAGSREIATQLTDPNAQYRSGVDRLTDGAAQLKDGTAELAAGMVTLDAGVDRLSAGAVQLQEGAGQLATGLTAGAEAAPDFGGEEERMSLAALLSTPMTKEHQNLAQAQFSGPGGAPAILLIASMLVPIVVFLTFRGQRFVSDEETPRTLADVGRRAVAVSGVSLAVMAVVGVLAWITRDPMPEPARMWQVVLITIAATLMNVALVSVLFTLFGYIVGTLASLSWFMLQLFSYGGIWMIQTMPAPFKWLNPISPLTYVRDGYIAGFNGVGGFWGSLVILIVIGLIGLAITFWAAGFQRKRYEKARQALSDEQTEQLVGAVD
ncbi:hypothetical protein GOHSU_22_01060 [Gordonia hirsuta DSM 44140 = NBRC 16056]|uniref:ABC-2 type transporter transmembrane domain-containing protein n=1 Tax=Gordonia hirsuta DSM 44140 = NBRC 16056 TaxID=1121927 RepID=L7LA69_9ACTN|nr:YhgE/Pip family protein [Gordonia hirsuta]GAC57646.1 hypothetical protein GOHSU_22_01060 [Gordonia hirsuta DSM 44140 = NBRC 16056]